LVISKFDGTNWTTYKSNELIRTVAIDSQQNKWFGKDCATLYKFDGTNWTNYNTGGCIIASAVDKLGFQWFGGGNAVHKFNGTNFTAFYSASYIKAIVIDAQNNKWFATSGGGIFKFNDTIWTNYTTSNYPSLRSNFIVDIAIDAQNNKWFVTNYGFGIAVLNADGSWSNYTASPNRLISNSITAIAVDAQGNKWIGTSLGISKLSTCYLAINNVTVQHATCGRSNGSLSVQAACATGVTYSLNGGTYLDSTLFTHLSSGVYRVSARDANGNVVTSDSIRINNLSVNTPVSFSFARQGNRTIQFTNTTTNLTNPTYSWTFGDGQTSNAASPAITYLQSGTYTVKLLVKNNGSDVCRDSSSQVILGVPTEDLTEFKMMLYPNPVSETLTLESPIATQIRILNSIGEVVQTLPLNAGKNPLTVQAFATGIYWIQYLGGALKFVKQ
jgi:hypothetical protein